MQEEGTAPGALTENSSLPAQGGESDFLHLPGLGCTLRYLNTPEVVRLHSSPHNNPALGLVSQMSKEPALKAVPRNATLTAPLRALLGWGQGGRNGSSYLLTRPCSHCL